MALTTTNASNLLKDTYGKYENLSKPLYEGSPTYALLPKRRFVGKNFQWPIKTDRANTGNIEFNDGYTLAANNAPEAVRFSVDIDKYRTHWRVNDEVGERLMNEKGGFTPAAKFYMEDARDELIAKRQADPFASGWGELGHIASSGTNINTTANTFKFDRDSDIRRFWKGQVLQAVATRGSAARSGTMIVTKVDPSSRTITCSAGLVTGLANGDYIFKNGDYKTTRPFLYGFPAYTPTDAELSSEGTSFLNVNRQVGNRARVAGIDVGARGSTNWEKYVLDAFTQLSHVGGKANLLCLPSQAFTDFVDELGSKVEYQKDTLRVGGQKNAEVGFDYIAVHTVVGTVKVYSDPWCPDNRMFGFQRDSYEILHMKDSPVAVWDDGDGLAVNKIPGQAQYGGSFMSYMALVCKKPLNTLTGSL